MSVTVMRTEGVTVLTVTNDRKSDCPLLCQILGNLCYSPLCSVSQRLKGTFGGKQTALGMVQVMIGLLNISIGAIVDGSRGYDWNRIVGQAPYWLGSLFILFGGMCILAEKFPSPCLVVITGIMNFISAAFAVTAIVMYAVGMNIVIHRSYHDNDYDYDPTAQPPSESQQKLIESSRATAKLMWCGMDIIMIVFAALQLCIAISAGVLAFKAACKKETAGQDPELTKPLVDEILSYPTV
ncbi:uncharacterized protein LOC105891873 [Clupea harengus]|uniref:Uncharacterized protein LOC105891873 n=1 Tax=Clupea harengus TaxID=7950 RepID=A0A6P3VJH9_CLUHA|nr:uncharacterized protein LOC105891873 [Clupea harengus]